MIVSIIFLLFFNTLLFLLFGFLFGFAPSILLPIFILPGIMIVLIVYKNNKKALFQQIIFSVLINLIWIILLYAFLQGNQCGGFPNVCKM